jgi:threonine dehydratase
VERTRAYGATVTLEGETLSEAEAAAHRIAADRGLVFVHPYDDARIVAGQGTIALEILDGWPEVDTLVVPIGGGGLIGGIALTAKALRPDVAVVGVQTPLYPAMAQAVRDEPPALPGGATVAEGIAVKRPGVRTLAAMRARVNDMLLVDEVDIEDAIALLLDVEKTVSEGAGAAGLAAVRRHGARWHGRKVVTVVSGGNVDLDVLSQVIQRHLVRTARLVRLRVELPDVPGALAEIARVLGEMDSNIVEINHQRDFAASSVRSVLVEFVLQMRGEEQAGQVLAALRGRGYAAEALGRGDDASG